MAWAAGALGLGLYRLLAPRSSESGSWHALLCVGWCRSVGMLLLASFGRAPFGLPKGGGGVGSGPRGVATQLIHQTVTAAASAMRLGQEAPSWRRGGGLRPNSGELSEGVSGTFGPEGGGSLGGMLGLLNAGPSCMHQAPWVH